MGSLAKHGVLTGHHASCHRIHGWKAWKDFTQRLCTEVTLTILYHYKVYSETHLCFFLLFFKKNPHYELVWLTHHHSSSQPGLEAARALPVPGSPPVTLPAPTAPAAASTSATTVSGTRAALPGSGPGAMPARREEKEGHSTPPPCSRTPPAGTVGAHPPCHTSQGLPHGLPGAGTPPLPDIDPREWPEPGGGQATALTSCAGAHTALAAAPLRWASGA